MPDFAVICILGKGARSTEVPRLGKPHIVGKGARVRAVLKIAPPLDQAALVPRSIQNKGLDWVLHVTAASRSSVCRVSADGTKGIMKTR